MKKQTARRTGTPARLLCSPYSTGQTDEIESEIKKNLDLQQTKILDLVAILKKNNQQLQTELTTANDEINQLKEKCAKLEAANKQYEIENNNDDKCVNDAVQACVKEASAKKEQRVSVALEATLVEYFNELNQDQFVNVAAIGPE